MLEAAARLTMGVSSLHNSLNSPHSSCVVAASLANRGQAAAKSPHTLTRFVNHSPFFSRCTHNRSYKLEWAHFTCVLRTAGFVPTSYPDSKQDLQHTATVVLHVTFQMMQNPGVLQLPINTSSHINTPNSLVAVVGNGHRCTGVFWLSWKVLRFSHPGLTTWSTLFPFLFQRFLPNSRHTQF